MVWTEARGFDSIWLTEHHFIDYGLSVSPAVLAAAAAMRTRRERIGLAAATLPFHYPIRLAEELAIVDILNEGRLDVGQWGAAPPSAACPCSTPCCADRSSSSPRAATRMSRRARRRAGAPSRSRASWADGRVAPHLRRDNGCRGAGRGQGGGDVVPEIVAAFSHPRADRSRAPAAAAGVPGDGGAVRAGLVGAVGRGERRLRLPRHRRRAGRRAPASGGRRNALLDELRRSASGARAALDGALRPRGHAAVPLRRSRPLTSAGPAPCRSPT